MKTEDNIADICINYEGDWKLELTKDKWDYKIIQIEQYKIESISLWYIWPLLIQLILQQTNDKGGYLSLIVC